MGNLFHEVSIGSVKIPGNLFLAPVAGYSDRAFRSVCYRGGANFAYTEMVSAEALTRGSDKTRLIMLRAPREKQYAIQLFGGTPEVIGKAVEMVLSQKSHDLLPEVIDINGGCPVPKITKTGAGSVLTKEPERLFRIVSAAVKASKTMWDNCGVGGNDPVPITIKIRSGWDAQTITWKESTEAALAAGAAAITLHGRTRAQGYEGKADWEILKDLVMLVKGKTAGKVPVFGSGDVFSPEDAKKMLEQTACDGVMFARGAMGNPFVFSETRQLLETGVYEEPDPVIRIAAGMEELSCLIQDVGEESACKQMRKRFCAYSKGIPGGAELRAFIVNACSKDDYSTLFQKVGLLALDKDTKETV